MQPVPRLVLVALRTRRENKGKLYLQSGIDVRGLWSALSLPVLVLCVLLYWGEMTGRTEAVSAYG